MQECFESVAIKRIKEVKGTNSLVGIYKMSEELDGRDVVTLVGDFLLAGIETSGNTMAFLLYELSKNPCMQEILEKSVRGVGEINDGVLKRFQFGKAVIQENFRLHPISVGVGRKLATNGVFSGYEIPAGTQIVTQNQISCRLEVFCPIKPNEFYPDRFLNKKERLHPFLSLPFGFGPRMCIGRRMAELSIQILLLRLAQNFHFEFNGNGPVGCKTFLINQPDVPIKLKLYKK